jgi:hypothetical protein
MSAVSAPVGRGRAADGDEDHGRSGRRRRGDQLAGAVGRRRPGVALGVAHQMQAGRGRHLDDRRPATLDESELRGDLPSQGIVRVRADKLAAELGQEDLQRAFAAVGHGAQIGRHQPRLFKPTADRAGDLGRAERALEGVGRDEDRTLSDRQARIVARAASIRADTDSGDRT